MSTKKTGSSPTTSSPVSAGVPAVPPELRDAILAGKCAVFVGAGLSMAAGYPSWKGLLKRLATLAHQEDHATDEKLAELLQLTDKGDDLLMVAQELSDLFVEDEFRIELVKVFKEHHEPTTTHFQLPEIPFSLAMTTNYDTLLENTYAKAMSPVPTKYTNNQAADFGEALWNGDFFILKAHGDVDTRSTMVVTERDYRKIIHSSPGYHSMLTAIFTTKTVLFLGVSLSDPELKLLLRYLHDAMHGSTPKHFALVSDREFSHTPASRWKKDFRVKCLIYTPSDDTHPEVDAFVKQLPRRKVPGAPTAVSAIPKTAAPKTATPRTAPRKSP